PAKLTSAGIPPMVTLTDDCIVKNRNPVPNKIRKTLSVDGSRSTGTVTNLPCALSNFTILSKFWTSPGLTLRITAAAMPKPSEVAVKLPGATCAICVPPTEILQSGQTPLVTSTTAGPFAVPGGI